MTDRLNRGETLAPGQELVSANGFYRAVMQADGNFVVYAGSRSMWSSGTASSTNAGSELLFRTNNVLVIRRPSGVVIWTVNSSAQAADYLVMQDDGNLVLYGPSGAIWASNTTQQVGIELRTASGKVYFSTASQTWSYLGTLIAQPGQSATLNIPAISLVSEVIFQRSFIDSPPGNQEAYIHSVSLSGTTVVALNGNVRTLITVLGR